MNYLQLVNKARRECGVSGSALLTLGGTMSDESTRFAGWVNDAWIEVQQGKDDWSFMQRPFSFETAAGDGDYTAATLSTPITNLQTWKRNSFRLYTTANGPGDEQILPFLDYQQFRDLYLFGPNRTQQSRPVQFTVAPDMQILLGMAPDGTYTVNGEYFCAPADLSVDADTPLGLPASYHMLIVYRAMYHYALYESAAEVLSRAEAHIRRLTTRLEVEQLPKVTLGATLA